MTPQVSLGWAVASAGAVLLAGAGVVWLSDPLSGFLAGISGLVAFVLLLFGVTMSVGGLWIVNVQPRRQGASNG